MTRRARDKTDTRRPATTAAALPSAVMTFGLTEKEAGLRVSRLVTSPPRAMRSTAMIVSVCLSARTHISKPTCPNFTHFSIVLPVAVARSSSDDTAMRYVLPVLRMTSCFQIIGHFSGVRQADVRDVSQRETTRSFSALAPHLCALLPAVHNGVCGGGQCVAHAGAKSAILARQSLLSTAAACVRGNC